jgi:hypothetical protein
MTTIAEILQEDVATDRVLFHECVEAARQANRRGFSEVTVKLNNTRHVAQAIERLKAEGFKVERTFRAGTTTLGLSWLQ